MVGSMHGQIASVKIVILMGIRFPLSPLRRPWKTLKSPVGPRRHYPAPRQPVDPVRADHILGRDSSKRAQTGEPSRLTGSSNRRGLGSPAEAAFKFGDGFLAVLVSIQSPRR
jgi:hypothetical protein